MEAQTISVHSFDLLERDLDARVHNRVYDQNGELCALIKVVTPHTGFEWEPDALGIVESIRKTGEYWLYVPRGARRITIKHDDLGFLRNYEYPIAIRSGDVYEMVLTTADIQVIVTDPVLESQWLAITTEPKGADVYINDQLAGNTEQDFSRRYPEGEYTYRIEMRGYHTEAGLVTLWGDREVLHFDLRPNVGNVYVTSEPESGMTIFLNGDDTGETTPATLHGISSGQHDIRLVSRWYQPKVQTITVEDNETTNVSFLMSPAFAEITIQTEPDAAIYIDDERVAQGMHTTRLMTGVYDIAARLEKHREDKRQLHVEAGVLQEIKLSPEAITGNLDATSSPIGAGIRLTDVATGTVTEHGTTPNTLRNLLIGDYEVELSRSGHATVSERVTIVEGETEELNVDLPAGMEVTITSEPSGAALFINGERVGTTPYTNELGFGSHQLRLVNQGRTVEESIEIRQGDRRNFSFDVAVFRCGINKLVDERDGNEYETVQIGSQCWMKENLKWLPSVSRPSNGSGTSPHYYVNGYEGNRVSEATGSVNYRTYGVLYNWPAALNACPPGWRLPSDQDWEILTDHLGGRAVAGGKMKTTGTSHWNRPNIEATNESGFSALPGGGRWSGGSFLSVGSYGYWWSATEGSRFNAWYRSMRSNYGGVHRYYLDKRVGFSIRCLRDN